MASWGEIEREAPELTALARSFFDALKHKTLATLRRDGAPRLDGSGRQGGRPAPRPALRAAQRLARPGGVARGREDRRARDRGDRARRGVAPLPPRHLGAGRRPPRRQPARPPRDRVLARGPRPLAAAPRLD